MRNKIVLLTMITLLLAALFVSHHASAADNYGSIRNNQGRDATRTICTYRPGNCGNNSCEKVLVCVTPTGILSATPTGSRPTPPAKAPMCKQSVSDIQFADTCDTKNFKYKQATYSCADGTKGTLGDGEKCNTVSKWISEVRKECRTHASCEVIPTPSSGTPTPSPCLKHMGDANCDGSIDMVDFEVWREEFTKEKSGLDADFNADNTVDLIDFEIWREGSFPEDLPPLPTPTDMPVASASATPTGLPPVSCGWCGNTCAPFEEDKLCPMVMPDESKTCKRVEKDGQMECAAIQVTGAQLAR